MTIQKLTLVGAGPGDPGLITLKGVEALKSADVILYDALANPAFLDYAGPKIPKIFVGKRNNGQTSFTQSQINDLIIDSILKYGHVVRLKGGDPFIFGRGYEEVLHARKFNIETAYVPGISSSFSVPGLQGIPVTHRGVSKSFSVVTATGSDKKLTNELIRAALGNNTIVILMGLSKLQQIVTLYRSLNKRNATVAIIQSGSTVDEKIVLGTIETIEHAAVNANIKAPAIIIIGDVVKLHPEFPPVLSRQIAAY